MIQIFTTCDYSTGYDYLKLLLCTFIAIFCYIFQITELKY